MTSNGEVRKKASELKVGDILEVSSGENVPADCLVLKTKYFYFYTELISPLFLSKQTSLMEKLIGSFVKPYFQNKFFLQNGKYFINSDFRFLIFTN